MKDRCNECRYKMERHGIVDGEDVYYCDICGIYQSYPLDEEALLAAEKKNCGCGKDPCVTYGAESEKKPEKDHNCIACGHHSAHITMGDNKFCYDCYHYAETFEAEIYDGTVPLMKTAVASAKKSLTDLEKELDIVLAPPLEKRARELTKKIGGNLRFLDGAVNKGFYAEAFSAEWWDGINNEYNTHRGHSLKQSVGGFVDEIWGTRDGEEVIIFSQIPDYYTGTMYQKYPEHTRESYRESFLESLEQNKNMAKTRLMAEIEENIGKGVWTIEPYTEWYSRNKKWFLDNTWWGKTQGSTRKKTLIGSHAYYQKNWKEIQKTIDRHPTQQGPSFDKPNESGWVATTTLNDLEKPLDFVFKKNAETFNAGKKNRPKNIDYTVKAEIEGFWPLENFVVYNYGEDYLGMPLSESQGYWDIHEILPNVKYTDDKGKIHTGIAVVERFEIYHDGKCEDCGARWNIDANYDGDVAYCPECEGKLIDLEGDIFNTETFNSYKVAPELSSYTVDELVDSIAGPQGSAAYDEMVYDPIAQDRQSAESFSLPKTLLLFGAMAAGLGFGVFLTKKLGDITPETSDKGGA